MVRRFLLFLCAAFALSAQTATVWKQVWSDEFNAAAGTAPDPSKWNFDLGNNNGWGNGELENYTSSAQNAFQDGKGNLVIRAIRDAAGNYTSARLQTGSPGASTHTADGNWQYGRIAARIKLPFGQGVWPAFWMLGENFATAGWPTCGELDIMENFGTFHDNSNVNNGTAHGPGYSGGSGISKSYTLPRGQRVYDDYHVYSIDWAPDSVEWFVDGVSFHKVTPASLPKGARWVFNAPFFILLNLAVGGPKTPFGTPDPNAPFPPQDMLVDYVRIYQAAPAVAGAPSITPGGVVNAAAGMGTLSPGALAAVYGADLAGAATTVSGTDHFPFSLGDVSVSVNGAAAALIYASPSQIDFQIPWATPISPAIDVKVRRGALESDAETIAISPAAPSVFFQDAVNGIAWLTGSGGNYQLWANGFGAKNGPAQDGVPPAYAGSLTPLQVPGDCQLTVDGVRAVVQYCGAAPGLIIDQLNFSYPPGNATAFAEGALTINGMTAHFRLPAPR
jgi:uncharacterized protein (TIGR03437 family)